MRTRARQDVSYMLARCAEAFSHVIHARLFLRPTVRALLHSVAERFTGASPLWQFQNARDHRFAVYLICKRSYLTHPGADAYSRLNYLAKGIFESVPRKRFLEQIGTMYRLYVYIWSEASQFLCSGAAHRELPKCSANA